jgi:cytochrome c551/c552
MNRITACVGVVLLAAEALIASQPPSAGAASAQQALVDKYCVGCHNDRRKSGGFSWTSIDLADPARNAEASERVVKKLRAGLMPPAGSPRPEAARTKALVESLETAIDRAAAAHPFAGAPELHRVNRTEYRNSIRDLLALDVDVASLLPPDESGRGFDNIADALDVTPALVQGYVRAAS